MLDSKNLQRIVFLATLLGMIVVILGAYTRLDDAGLGCPDWPGCYGKLLGVPNTAKEISVANASFPAATPVQESNPWPEMVHRYVAGTLGMLVFIIFAFSCKAKELPHKNYRKIATLISLLILMQATLGMWTVTWLLVPWVVMSHLLGGMTITSLLWWQTLSGWAKQKKHAFYETKTSKKLALIALILVFLQISLGGWTAATYSALICPDFPFCRGSLFPEMDLVKGFSLMHPVGINYEGGVLAEKARIAIQMVHRYGAFVVTAYLSFVCSFIITKEQNIWLRKCAIIVLSLLAVQVLLGVLNIVWLLPIAVAVTHNGVGLLLLMSCATMFFFSIKKYD